jgi:hypothetical protein
MVETFYKTELPDGHHEETAEYYTLALTYLSGPFFVVEEHHGWWDNVAKKARLKTITLSTADEPTTETEAWRLYNAAREYMESQRFVHVYQRDFMTGNHTHVVLGVAKK